MKYNYVKFSNGSYGVRRTRRFWFVFTHVSYLDFKDRSESGNYQFWKLTDYGYQDCCTDAGTAMKCFLALSFEVSKVII